MIKGSPALAPPYGLEKIEISSHNRGCPVQAGGLNFQEYQPSPKLPRL